MSNSNANFEFRQFSHVKTHNTFTGFQYRTLLLENTKLAKENSRLRQETRSLIKQRDSLIQSSQTKSSNNVASEVNEWRNKVQLLKQDLNTFHELFNDQFNKFYDKLTIINITNDTSSDDTTTATELTNNRLSISEYSVSSNFLSELETSFIECDLMDSLNSTNPQPTYPTTTVIEVIDQNESSTDKENIDPTQENKPSATTTTIKQTSANKASISLIKPRQSTVLPNAPVKKLKTLTIREPWKIATKVRPSKPKVKLTRIANNSSKRYNPDASVYEFDSKTEETSKLPKLNLRSSRMRF